MLRFFALLLLLGGCLDDPPPRSVTDDGGMDGGTAFPPATFSFGPALVADVNGDGKDDLIVPNRAGEGGVYILHGGPAFGTRSHLTLSSPGARPQVLATANLGGTTRTLFSYSLVGNDHHVQIWPPPWTSSPLSKPLNDRDLAPAENPRVLSVLDGDTAAPTLVVGALYGRMYLGKLGAITQPALDTVAFTELDRDCNNSALTVIDAFAIEKPGADELLLAGAECFLRYAAPSPTPRRRDPVPPVWRIASNGAGFVSTGNNTPAIRTFTTDEPPIVRATSDPLFANDGLFDELVVGKLDTDARPDIVLCDSAASDGTLQVLMNLFENGTDVSFNKALPVKVAKNARPVIGDFDGDGRGEIRVFSAAGVHERCFVVNVGGAVPQVEACP